VSWLLGLSVACALSGNDVLQLTLLDGSEVEGFFHHGDEAEVTLTSAAGPVTVPVVLVSSVLQNGELLPMHLFYSELVEMKVQHDLWLAAPPPMPAPGLVFSSSLLWAGSGHAMLGDWKGFAEYSVIETVLIGGMLWAASEQNIQFLIPLVGLDAIFKGRAARDSHRIALRRRTRFQVDPDPLTLGGLP